MSTFYLWIKAFHVVSLIAWVAGLLYLPRLYVYHADAKQGGEASEMLMLMERRLLRVIINPAMIATLVFGLTLIWILGWEYFKSAGWLHAKLAFVLALATFHAFLARWRREFAEGRNRHDAKFYRRVNEIPTLLMVLIVLLAVVKPF